MDLNKELNRFYEKVRDNRWHDNNFAREDDVDLTEDEIKAIDEYWGKYSFAYPEIFYDSFKIFKNRCGRFDVRHCPGAIRVHYFDKYFNHADYNMAHQNKGMYSLIYPGVPMPVTIVRKMSGIYYDIEYNPIEFDKAAEIILSSLKNGEDIILKPSGAGGGKLINFLYANDDNTLEDVEKMLKKYGRLALVAQHMMEQSPFMNRFNASSVNTIRVTTLLHQGKAVPLGSLVRIGAPGAVIDNFTQGGAVLGVDLKTGICNKWAMTRDLQRVTQLPSGLVLDKEDIRIPNFDKIVETVLRMHYYTPYNKLISWDMALDKDNVPTMIENNFAGSLQLHEAVGGPLFGEYMDELCDNYLLKNFCVEFETEDWVFNEYSDHIEIKSYKGEEESPIKPKEIKGKPVKERRK